jgi:phytoene dehydrogenase-like protein
MRDAYDAIVIGGGHNGLVTAAYLARAGQRVLLLERRDRVGGAAITEELFPGFRFDIGAHRVGRLYPAVAHDLRLASRGVEIVACDPAAFCPTPDGAHLLLWRDTKRAVESIQRLSGSDAGRWSEFVAFVAAAAGFVQSLHERRPPNLLSKRAADLWELVRLAGRLRRLGRRRMMEAMRVLPMTVAELLDEWFEADLLKGTLGARGVTGLFQGPMASGTAYLFLHHHIGAKDGVWSGGATVRGGVGKLSQALAEAARERGVEIRTSAGVERIAVKDGRVTGVVLEHGEEIGARRVVSGVDPRRTFLELLDPAHLDLSFVRRVRNIRFRGAVAKVNLALGELPDFTCLPGPGPHLNGVISISPSVEYLERAYDDAKHGDVSQAPYLEVVIPSLSDPAMAPEGKHVMSVLVQYAPYDLREGVWDEGRREALGDRVVETLAQYAPNLRSAVVHRQVLTPHDLETIFGLSEGNIYHGEMTLDQLLFMRPVPGWSRYRAPVGGLYLCGAGTHPGGGVSGAPGYHAARAVLSDVKKSR